VWVEKISGEKSSVTTSHPRKVRFGGEKFVWVEKKFGQKSFVPIPPRKVRFGREKFVLVEKNLVKNPPSLSPLEKFVSVGKNTPLPALWEL